MKATLAAWNAQPNLAQSLAQFLGTKEGMLLMAVLEDEFGPQVDITPVVAGVDYMQVYAFRGNSYEACARVIKKIREMAVPRAKKPEPRESTPGFHATLQREPEKESLPAAKPTTRKKK